MKARFDGNTNQVHLIMSTDEADHLAAQLAEGAINQPAAAELVSIKLKTNDYGTGHVN